MSRCTGHCCRKFPLNLSPEELEWRAESFLDGPQVREMVSYVGLEAVTDPVTGSVGEMHHYTCRYFSEETGNCEVYEYRPILCREHPHYNRGAKCQHAKCTYDNLEGRLHQLVRKSEEAQKGL